MDKKVTGVISAENNFEIPSFMALKLTAPTKRNIARAKTFLRGKNA